MSADANLEKYRSEVPPPAKPIGVYKPYVISGNLLYTSGHLPSLPDGTLLTGRVGDEVDQEAGYQAARQTGLALLSTLQEAVGSLSRVKLVKIVGLVNCTADFKEHPGVVNGCSELFKEVLGDEAGVGARSAFGLVSLPKNVTTEIEAIFEIIE
ncbi:MAG: RidA family protein [Pirellulaceae bacterium]|nr:RidA family protein [Pirellulaceae bacterium]